MKEKKGRLTNSNGEQCIRKSRVSFGHKTETFLYAYARPIALAIRKLCPKIEDPSSNGAIYKLTLLFQYSLSQHSVTLFHCFGEHHSTHTLPPPSETSFQHLHSIMGGCVSSPKDLALNEGEAPVESPTTPKNAEAETVAQENAQENESEEKEEPLVNLSEAKEENVEAKAEEAEAATETQEAAKEEAPKAEEDKKEEPLVTL